MPAVLAMTDELVAIMIAKVLKVRREVVRESMTLEEIGADDLSLLDLLEALQDEDGFDMAFAEDEVELTTTVGRVIELVKERQPKRRR